ncbi:MAG: PilN domain-containing protein, partial [Planctomycetota bacterium]
KRNTLNHHLEPYRAAGIEPQRVALEPLAIQNWFGNMDTSLAGPAVSVVADEHRAVILTSVDNRLQKTNEIASSGTDRSVFAREVLQEVLNQREELAQSATEQVPTFVAGTEPCLSEITNVSASTSSDGSTNNVVIVAGPRLERYGGGQQELDNGSFNCAAVVAAGLFDLARSSKLPFCNLLPQKSLRKLQQKSLLLNYLVTGGAFVAVVVLLWLCLFVMNWRTEWQSRKIELQIAPIEDIAGGVERKRQRVRAIQNQLSSRGLITEIFKEIYKFTPKNISISQIKFLPKSRGAFVEIRGQAASLQDAYEYTETMLREAALLNKIEIVNNQVIPRPRGSIAEFKAQCVIRSD